MLSDLKRSPYADRIFVALDAVHAHGLTQHLVDMGVSKNRIIVWPCNGVEHVYPRAILEKHFGNFGSLGISDDLVSANGLDVKKRELAAFVCNSLIAESELPTEMQEKLMTPLESALF